ncbi:hypothetical protein F1559_003529 [Cyanidiococcus yangmingshanensis]|uniref:Uncharacterized protein n=1 Tax=Cyanidiococcus yangmingshanensis TaxID=2690220 RepID=A0A7J7IHD1_9RHOD|nr:hypothetical protein F1559_003529 [Cyanidiococcus yangmingshanensis]
MHVTVPRPGRVESTPLSDFGLMELDRPLKLPRGARLESALVDVWKLGFLFPGSLPVACQSVSRRDPSDRKFASALRKRGPCTARCRNRSINLLCSQTGFSSSGQETDSNAGAANDRSGEASRYGGPVPSSPTRPFDASVVHPSWYINMRPDNPCVVCLGEGHIRCMHCDGAGYVVVGPEPDEFPERDRELCAVCYGEGKHCCRRCDGSGKRPMWIFDPETRERRPITLERDLPWKKALMEIAEAEMRRGGSENITHE